MPRWIKTAWAKVKEPSAAASRNEIWKRIEQPVLGVSILCSLAFVIIAVDLLIRHPNYTAAQLFETIHRWQTLIAGVFALFAAVVTARSIVMQVDSSETAEKTRRTESKAAAEDASTRALKAARSVMPLSLSVLAEYTTAIAKAAIYVLDRSKKPRVEMTREELPALPTMPQSIIEDLKAFILAAPDGIGDNVADILSDLQLLSANARNTWERTISKDEGQIVMPSNYEALVGRAAVLHARLSALLDYARREADEAPIAPSEEKVAKALQYWMVFSDTYPGCHTAAAAYIKQATSPVA